MSPVIYNYPIFGYRFFGCKLYVAKYSIMLTHHSVVKQLKRKLSSIKYVNLKRGGGSHGILMLGSQNSLIVTERFSAEMENFVRALCRTDVHCWLCSNYEQWKYTPSMMCCAYFPTPIHFLLAIGHYVVRMKYMYRWYQHCSSIGV